MNTALVIPSNALSNLRVTWTFAVLWSVVSVPIVVLVPRELERNPPAAIAFLFPIVGVRLLTWAVITTLRWRRFGPTSFEMSAAARPGGRCSGTIRAKLPSDSAAPIRVILKLTCLERTIRRSGKRRTVTESIRWREEYEVPRGHVAFGPLGASIPVQFALPSDALPTTAIGRGPGIVWVLTAEADLSGVDLKEDFDVPVAHASPFDTAAPAAAFTTQAIPGARPVSASDLAASGIHIRSTPEGTEYYFGPARNPGAAFGTAAFLLLWTGAIWLQFVLDGPWPFIIVFAFVDFLLVIVVTDLFFGATTVTIGGGVVKRRHSSLGISTTRVHPFQTITDLDLHIGMQSTGRFGTPYYEIRATLDTGKHTHLGSGIRSKPHAEWILERMRGEIPID